MKKSFEVKSMYLLMFHGFVMMWVYNKTRMQRNLMMY